MSYFTPSGSAGVPQSISISGATNPTTVNVPMLLAATEYSYILPTGTKQFLMKLQGPSPFQVSYVLGESSTNFLTVPWGCFYAESDLALNAPVTIYFQSSAASQTAEIRIWT